MALSDFLFGRGEGRMEQVPTMTPQQQQLLSQMLGGLRGRGGPLQLGIQNLAQLLSGAPEALEAYQRPELRRFEEETIPGIAERFTQLGAQRTGAFPQALGAAGASLGEMLAAQRAQLQQAGMGQLGGLLGAGLGARPFETIYRPPEPGFLQALAPGLGTALGYGLPGAFGAAGAGLSGLLGRLFGGGQQTSPGIEPPVLV